MRILIVDDKKEDLYLLETLLRRSGFEVSSAMDGEEALKKLRSEGADLVISDILMPVMDGFRLCQEVRKDERLRAIPFVFYTATYTDEKDEELALKIGADRFLRKPFEPEELVRAIREVSQEVDRKKIREAPVLHEEEEILRLYSERLVKKLEKRNLELQDLERKYRILYGNVNDAIFSVDENGYFIDVNYRMEMFGYSPEEVIGKHFNEFLTPQSQKIALGYFEKAQKGRVSRDIYEVEIVKKDGGIVNVELSVSTIYEDQKFIGRFGIARDITERKRMEEELRKSEERYRELFENIPIGIYRTNPEGEIIDANPAMVQMLGYPDLNSLLATKSKETYVNPEDRAKWQEIMDREGEVRNYEKKLRRHNGSVIWVQEDNRAIRDTRGRVVYYEGAIEDITERKRAEQEMASLQEQLRQAQKMEAIGRLAGGIAHDFNNILTVIKGVCQLSLLDLREGDPLYGNLKEIDRSAERAADLTRQLLAFSRKQILEPQVLDLNGIIRNLDKMLRRLLGEDIELVTFFNEKLGRVKVDSGQIEQAIINLAVNARDAMPKGGKLTIETANVELDEEYAKRHIGVKPGPYVMLSISDTGMGMTPEIKERIFEPFFTTKEMGKGTGLGLSTVYGIVKQSGGNIWVYSEPGQGTTFKIYLPRVDEPLEEIKEKVIEEIPLGSETILVVEDEEMVRKLAVRLLKKQGYHVLEASDGGKAFMLCEKYQESIHLILSDVVMPGINGRELVERLQKIHPEARALYMSGYTDNVILHHGILEKGIEFISKPFTLESLTRKVREVLDK